MPGPPFVGNTLRLLRAPLEFTLACARACGDVADMNVRLMTIYLVSHPDLIEQVLVTKAKIFKKDVGTRSLRQVLGEGLLTSEGEFWKRQRRLAQPGFHRERVAAYGAVMVEHTERMLASWGGGGARNLHEDMMGLTREIVAKTLFDADVRSEGRHIDEAFQAIVQRFQDAPPGVPVVGALPTEGKRRFERALRTLDQVIYGLVAERRSSGRDRGDLLSMLISAEDERGGRMSERQIRDEAMTLFLAGHETTAAALTWTFNFLTQNPEAEARLFRELDEVLGNRAPSVGDLPNLTYTEGVIHESMRLMPPAWAIGREPVEDCEIGGYHVPAGTQVWISQYVMHRDPRYFNDPEVFRPERWANDFAKKLPRYAYFPFGGGPRVCIGNSFALMETQLCLAAIARRYRVRVVSKQPLAHVAAVTLRPKEAVRAVVEERRKPL
ncbi:MAG: cytochrome P450 [Polyangiaceae bacterium]|nr:cytochrome P450 [Polyangiaceae bacterium]